MLVYMLINVITEKAYVGQTQKSLAERWKDHKRSAAEGSDSPLHTAIREWNNDELWDRVVLQVCYSIEQLNQAEEVWMTACSTRDGAVGYNVRRVIGVSYDNVETGMLASKNPNTCRPRADMSEELLEYFRQCGRRGGRQRSDMSEDELKRFRDWGRMGAIASKKNRQTA
jgi:hypothetical protein